MPLSTRLLEELRAYWRVYRPRDRLFPGQKPGRPLNGSHLQRRFIRARKQAGLTKHCSMHTLRHSYVAALPVRSELPAHRKNAAIGSIDRYSGVTGTRGKRQKMLGREVPFTVKCIPEGPGLIERP